VNRLVNGAAEDIPVQPVQYARRRLARMCAQQPHRPWPVGRGWLCLRCSLYVPAPVEPWERALAPVWQTERDAPFEVMGGVEVAPPLRHGTG